MYSLTCMYIPDGFVTYDFPTILTATLHSMRSVDARYGSHILYAHPSSKTLGAVRSGRIGQEDILRCDRVLGFGILQGRQAL